MKLGGFPRRPDFTSYSSRRMTLIISSDWLIIEIGKLNWLSLCATRWQTTVFDAENLINDNQNLGTNQVKD